MASALVDKVKGVIQPHHENGGAGGHCCSTLPSGPGYASPADALKGPREKLLYITAVYTGSPLCSCFEYWIHTMFEEFNCMDSGVLSICF